MTVDMRELTSYADESGNSIVYEGTKPQGNIRILFVGKNNRVTVHPGAKFAHLFARFDGDNGVLTVGDNPRSRHVTIDARIGQDSTIAIGNDVSTTGKLVLSAVEGSTLRIGDDVMIASECQIRCDDAHPIFDVRTRKRINPSQNIDIGNHVWLGYRATVLGGARIGSGSVIGLGSVVKAEVPNNVIAVGSPARVVRKDIAWERPHLSLEEPAYKPDADALAKLSAYWALTEHPPPSQRAERVRARVRRAFSALSKRRA